MNILKRISKEEEFLRLCNEISVSKAYYGNILNLTFIISEVLFPQLNIPITIKPNALWNFCSDKSEEILNKNSGNMNGLFKLNSIAVDPKNEGYQLKYTCDLLKDLEEPIKIVLDYGHNLNSRGWTTLDNRMHNFDTSVLTTVPTHWTNTSTLIDRVNELENRLRENK